jgi:single-strand DNA-binding protein
MSDLRLPDINKYLCAGRLTRDPELRYTNNSVAFCRFGVAVSKTYKTKDGTKREETLFLDVVAWRGTAEYVAEHMKKGTPVLVEGRLKANEWEDKNTGEKRSRIEVQAERVQRLDWSSEQSESKNERIDEQPATQEQQDDIPF